MKKAKIIVICLFFICLACIPKQNTKQETYTTPICSKCKCELYKKSKPIFAEYTRYLNATKWVDNQLDNVPFIEKFYFSNDSLHFSFVNAGNDTLYLLSGLFEDSFYAGVNFYHNRVDTLKKELILSFQPIYPICPSSDNSYQQNRYTQMPPKMKISVSILVKKQLQLGILCNKNKHIKQEELSELNTVILKEYADYRVGLQLVYYDFLPYLASSEPRFFLIWEEIEICNNQYKLVEKELNVNVSAIAAPYTNTVPQKRIRKVFY